MFQCQSRCFSLSWLMAPLERPLARGCQRWCRFVAAHPWPFLLLPILTTAILSSGMLLKFRVVRGVNYLYSALDAPWKEEYGTFMDNWAGQDQRFYPGKDALLRPGLFVLVTARDNGSVLRPAHCRQLRQLIDWVQSVPLEEEEQKGRVPRFFTFRDVCLQFPAGGGRCFSNENARLLAELFEQSSEQLLNPFNVTFPRFRLAQLGTEEPVELSSTLGGVQLFPDGRRLRSARAWMLLFQLRRNPPESIGQLSSQFEHSLATLIRQGQAPSSILQLAHYHSGTFDRELAENALQLAPKFGATFGLLVLFAVLCTFDWHWAPIWHGKAERNGKCCPAHLPAIDWVRSKPLLGLCGVLSTLMAIASAMGLLLWADVTFVDICAVMPFLSLTIGIDDTFLMLAAWRATSPALPVQARVEQAMQHAAVSIAITSLTDALAFLIGSIAPLPAVIYFCYYSSLAILFIFVHFMTMFVAVLALQGRWEAEGRHCLFHWHTQNADSPGWPEKRPSSTSLLSALLNSGRHCGRTSPPTPCALPSPPQKVPLDNSPTSPHPHWSQRLLSSFYVPFIGHLTVQLLALASLGVYICLMLNGVKQLTVGFKLIDIISFDLRARQFLLLREEFFPADVQRLDLAVMRPPNLGRPLERAQFLRTLAQLELLPNCRGRPGESQFWWREWQREAQANGLGHEFGGMDLDENAFSSALRPFLKANPRFDYDLLRSPGGDQLRAFRLSIQLVRFVDDAHLLRCARQIRQICHEHSAQFGLISYSPLWNLADQFEIIWPQTMQDLYISVGVMALVSLLLIPRPYCALVVAANILSIGFGVIGFMPYWGVNLDATSMITIAMSVGFSVDFAAHVTYAYIAEGQKREDGRSDPPMQCLRGALSSVGWPISQASFSVLLGIWPLATVNTHIIQTCFKTVFLVILFGWLHALVYLPLALMNTHRLYNWLEARWKHWRKWRSNNGGRGRSGIFVIN